MPVKVDGAVTASRGEDSPGLRHLQMSVREGQMKFLSSRRFLAVYSGVLTIVFCVTVLCGFTGAQAKRQSFDEIDVHRINVREPDGTLRMVISNMQSFPGAIVKGKEYPHQDRKTAGMLFYDNEGTEDGGLIFGGFKDAQGKVTDANVHLSFDQYMQDQVLTLDGGEENGEKYSTIAMNDQPDYPITETIEAMSRIDKLPKAEQGAAWKSFFATHGSSHQRVRLGRLEDKSAALVLKDVEGKSRIVMKVAADGTPSLQFLDADGRVVSELPQKR